MTRAADALAQARREAHEDMLRSADTIRRTMAKRVKSPQLPPDYDLGSLVDEWTEHPAPLVLVVPMPPTLTNSGKGRSRHWRVLEREKRGYWETLDAIALFGEFVTDGGWCGFVVPPPPLTPWLRVVLSSVMVLGGRMDTGNAYARHKWLEDWCVLRGYFATDREERKRDGAGCRWAALPTQHVTKKETPRITLTIQPEEQP